MFADPQSVTINGVTSSLPRVSTGDYTGTFMKDDGNVTMKVYHTRGKRVRHNVRLDHRKVAADPLIADQNLNYSMSVIMTIDVPPLGYSPTEVKQILDGLLANLAASTAANTVKLIGGES